MTILLIIFRLIHDFIAHNDRFGSFFIINKSRGATLYARLCVYIRQYMTCVISNIEANSSDKAKLVRSLELAASQIVASPRWYTVQSAILGCLYRNRLRLQRQHLASFEIPHADNLLQLMAQSFFIPEITIRVIDAMFVLTWTRPSIFPFLTSFVRDTMLSRLRYPDICATDRKAMKRPVYHASLPLGQLRPFSDRSKHEGDKNSSEGTGWLELGSYRPHSWFPFSHHWAVKVGNDQPAVASISQQGDHQAHHTDSISRPFVFELTRNQDCIDWKTGYPTEPFENIKLLGYTFCSDEEIQGHGTFDRSP